MKVDFRNIDLRVLCRKGQNWKREHNKNNTHRSHFFQTQSSVFKIYYLIPLPYFIYDNTTFQTGYCYFYFTEMTLKLRNLEMLSLIAGKQQKWTHSPLPIDSEMKALVSKLWEVIVVSQQEVTPTWKKMSLEAER